MCGYFCIWVTDFFKRCKNLLDYTNLFSPKEDEKNDNIMLIYFQ